MAYLPFANGLSALICGNNWNNGVHCGPRTMNANNYPWNVNTNIGARLACEEENIAKKKHTPLITVAVWWRIFIASD